MSVEPHETGTVAHCPHTIALNIFLSKDSLARQRANPYFSHYSSIVEESYRQILVTEGITRQRLELAI